MCTVCNVDLLFSVLVSNKVIKDNQDSDIPSLSNKNFNNVHQNFGVNYKNLLTDKNRSVSIFSMILEKGSC